ncbi:hypothetical protein [Natronococcus roseus]|uniref:hypothetical protein n=1 Tax=Natronococcus roseus TaxID=1052014 RepID=UPI00374D5FEB
MSNKEILTDRPTAKYRPREVLKYGETEPVLNGETALFDVLPSIGKTGAIPRIADGTQKPITYLTSLTDNYDQMEEWSEEHGVEGQKVPTREDCPPLRNEDPTHPDDPEAEKARAALKSGWSLSEVHRIFDPPCEQNGETCSYLEKLSEIDPDGGEMLIGHYSQGYNPAYIEDRVVVIDEDCINTFIDRIQHPAKKAKEFVDHVFGDEFPFDEVRRPELGEEEKQEKALEMIKEEGLESTDYPNSVGDFHALAPKMAYTIIGGTRLKGKGSLVARKLPSGGHANFKRIHEVNGDQHNDGKPVMWIPNPPDLSGAESVLALDATPSIKQWEFILGDDFEHYRLFDDQKRNQYLREQGHELIQLNSHVWPSQGGNLNLEKSEAYLREAHREHGERPDVITSEAVIKALREKGLDHLWDREMHYGNLRGKNDLKDSELLVVLGSPSRSDEHYQRIAALFREHAERATDSDGNLLRGVDRDYQSEVANDVLETTRRGGVFQAAMRAGREDGTEATVYIATGMVPEWLETKKVGQRKSNGEFDACWSTRTEKQKAVIEAMQGAEEISASEIVESANKLANEGVKKEAAKKIRQSLQEKGLVEKEGERRWARYYDTGLDEINAAGDVDLSSIGKTPFNSSSNGIFPIESDPIVPVRDPLANKERREPDWIREIQRKARVSWNKEQEKQYLRGEA